WVAFAWRSAYILVFRNLCSGSRLSSLILTLFSWGSGSSSFRRRSPCPLLWVDPMDLRLLLITVDLGLKPEATKWVRASGSLLFLGRPDGKSFRDIFVFFSLSRFVWWGARRTINQTREAHKPAKPTNSWNALRT